MRVHRFEKQTFVDSKTNITHTRLAIFMGADGSDIRYIDSKRQMIAISESRHEDRMYRKLLKDILQDSNDLANPELILPRRYTRREPQRSEG